MDQVIAAIVTGLMTLKDKDYIDGGFADEIELPEDVWPGDPGILSDHEYPFVFVEPETSEISGGTAANEVRDLTVRIGLVVDPSTYFDDTDTGAPEEGLHVMHAMLAIERWLRKKSTTSSGGLGVGARGVTIRTTSYSSPQRSVFSRGAQITVVVQKDYPIEQ